MTDQTPTVSTSKVPTIVGAGTTTTAAIIAGSAATLVIFLVNTYLAPTGGLPEQIDQAIQTLITAGAVYLSHKMSS